MVSADIVGYIYEGQVYCHNCVDLNNVQSDENWSVMFAESFDEYSEGYCCGTCNHNLACVNGLNTEYADNCPGCSDY